MHKIRTSCLFFISIASAAVLSAQSRGPERLSLASTVRGQRPETTVTTQPTPGSPLQRYVTLSLDNVPLHRVLEEIERQAMLKLIYTRSVVPLDHRVSITAKHEKAGDVLAKVLRGLGIMITVTSDDEVMLQKSGSSGGDSVKTGVVSGIVTDSATGDGLFGVSVTILGTNTRVVTAENGKFTIANVPVGSHVVAIRKVGFASVTRSVIVVNNKRVSVRVSLVSAPTMLSGVVTTATGQRQRLTVGNDISTINADSVVASRPIQTVTDLLEARVPDLVVQRSSGSPGAPARIRIRGVHSMNSGNDPILIVDGVRVPLLGLPNQATGGIAASVRQSPTADLVPSGLDQIDVNSIETINVLKGPSASALYGSDAANGVIIITTKRGKPGPVRWDLSAHTAATAIPGSYPLNYWQFGHVDNLFYGRQDVRCREFDPTCTVDSVVAYQWINNPRVTPLGTGHDGNLSMTVSGGSRAVVYSMTGSEATHMGVVQMPAYLVQQLEQIKGEPPPDWQIHPEQWNTLSGNASLTLNLNDNAHVTLNSVMGKSYKRTLGIANAIAIANALPPVSLDSLSVTFPTNRALEKTTSQSLTGQYSVNADWLLWQSLHLSGTGGVYLQTTNDNDLLRRGDCPSSYPTFDGRNHNCGNDSLGFALQAQASQIRTSIKLDATWQWPTILQFVNGHFSSGLEVNRTSSNSTRLSGKDLSVGGTDVPSAGYIYPPLLQGGRIATGGIYFEGGIQLGQVVYLNGSIRQDAGTGIGGAVAPKYPKFDVSFPFLQGQNVIHHLGPLQSVLSSFRIRAAVGQAGQQPNTTALRQRTFEQNIGVVDGQRVPVILISGIGNANLRPERGIEVEGGVDLGILHDRMTVGITEYRSTQRDQIVPSRLIPPSVAVAPRYQYGSPNTTRAENVGDVRNWGGNIVVDVIPFDTRALTWTVGGQISWDRNRVLKLAYDYLPDPSSPIRVGYPLFGMFAVPMAGYVDRNGDGILDPSEVLLGDSVVYMGAPYPKNTGAINSDISLFERFHIGASFSFQNGVTQRNQLGIGLLAANYTSLSLSQQALVLGEEKVLQQSQQRATLGSTAEFQTVSSIRWQSLQVSYDIPWSIVRRFHARKMRLVADGTNLGLWTKYFGKDPDVNSNPYGNLLTDAGVVPTPRTFGLSLQVGF